MTDPLLIAAGLHLSIGSHSILRGIALSLDAGEAVGLIGESGSGKSMFARSVMGLLPDRAHLEGSLVLEGRELVGLSDRGFRALRGSRIGYIPQDPAAAFNPTLRIGRQMREPAEFHPDYAAVVRPPNPAEMLRSVGIPEPEQRARQHPHEMSGGMLQRALIATAVSLGPSILLADEPTTGLDVTTQAEIMRLLWNMQQASQMALLLISHDLALVSTMCTRIGVLYRGNLVEMGPTSQIVGSPRHPYTRALLAATPRLRSSVNVSAAINGESGFNGTVA